ncbi:MAG: HAD family hydrolase [Ignavibacteriaceae bacterium]|nr:HAD family hydrolase [Ignavibacteriaceae bacterium]
MNIENKLKNINLVVFDLDGTLLDMTGEISDKTKQVITELENIGVRFSFASGRLHCALTGYAKELNIDTPLISLDGSMIKDYAEGKTIYESFIKEKHIKRAIKLADRYLVNLALCHADAIYYTETNTVVPQILDKFGAPYEEIPSYNAFTERTLELIFASDNKASIKLIKDKFAFPFTSGLNSTHYKSQKYGGIYYLELRRRGSSKGKALLRLIKKLNIPIEQTAVIGDWYNDLSLFQTKALKVALENAVPELKRMADILIDKDNNNNGVAEFLEMVLKAKTKK